MYSVRIVYVSSYYFLLDVGAGRVLLPFSLEREAMTDVQKKPFSRPITVSADTLPPSVAFSTKAYTIREPHRAIQSPRSRQTERPNVRNRRILVSRLPQG